MLEKLKSRKFFVVLSMLAMLGVLSISGEMVWAESVAVMWKIAVAYLIGQGLPDAMKELKARL